MPCSIVGQSSRAPRDARLAAIVLPQQRIQSSVPERPLCAKSGPSLRIIIYVRNIFGLPTKEASHPSMMETSRATTSAVPPTADIVGHRGHVRKVPILLQKSFWGGERKFLEPLMRLTRGDVRDHIDSPKIDHGSP